MKNVFAYLTKALKEDKIPWKRGWRTSQPYNAVSGNNYHGVNNLLLSFIAHEKGYSDPRWCTFKQAADNNWHINKGEKGTPIEFWSLYDSETKKKLTPAEADKLKNELSREDYQERVHPLSETYTVFNAEQISGIPELAFENNLVDVKSLIEKRDVLIENMGVNFLEQGWEAYYSEGPDLLSLPPVQEFNSDYEYFATLLHEGAHATGHENRLNRDLSGIKGSASYAKEELRAEIASAFVSQEIGFEQTEANIDNHKAYLQSWIEVLENNPDELYTAIRDAQKISDYLIEKGEFNQVIEQSTEKDIKSSSGDINLEQKGIIDKIEKFAQNYNVPIYKEIPEGFHINEGALTAPKGARWIQDNGSIIHNKVKRGLLLDKDLISLYQSDTISEALTPHKSDETILSNKTHALSRNIEKPEKKPVRKPALQKQSQKDEATDIDTLNLLIENDLFIYGFISNKTQKTINEYGYKYENKTLVENPSKSDELNNKTRTELEKSFYEVGKVYKRKTAEKLNELVKKLKGKGFESSWDEERKITEVYKPPEKKDGVPERVGFINQKGEFIKTNPDASDHPNSVLNFSQGEKHGLSQKNQNTGKSQRDNPILNTNNNAMKNIATNFLQQQQQGKRELLEQ